MMEASPPGWPSEVPPPAVEGWELRAAAWLFDQGPAELRGYPLLRRHPLILAYLIESFVSAANESIADALGRARVTLREWRLPPAAIDEAVAVHERELRRLGGQLSAVRLIAAALRGERWVPRL